MSSSLLDQYRYTISDIKLLDPPMSINRRHYNYHDFLLKIAKIDTSGNNEQLVLVHPPVEGKFGKNHIAWSEQTLYDVTAKFTINFKIFLKQEKTNELKTIGEYTNIMSGLLDIQESSGVCKVTLGEKSQLSFAVKEDRFKNMLDKAKQQSEGIYFSGGESWSTFFSYFEIVKTAADSAASLNPYAKQIWSIVSMVPNILQTHINRNSNVKELLQQLMDIYAYINEADRLPILRGTHGDKLKLLIDKTCYCADFIKKYTENNAAKNFMKGPSFDDRILEFTKSFDQIFKTIEHSLMVGIASNIEVSRLLADIPYADNVGLDHEKICLPGTRQKLIREILDWVDKDLEDTSERVLILSGHAGTGKSAVAHTIAKTLNDRLGSFFRFSRSNKGNINLLFSTISRDLADGDDSWRRNLVQAIKTTAIRKSFDPITQFNEMIIKPSNGMETTRRVVIIIDALDESGDERERKTLLNLLFIRSSELPSNYRIIITSRPEHDIVQFHQRSNLNIHCIYMACVDSNDTLNDIQQFVSVELSTVAKILDAVDKNWRLVLAQKAQSLFQWARTACVYILEFELEAGQRLRTVLSKSTPSLYEMYHQILDAQRECRFDSYVDLLKKCVGAVIMSRKPLSVSVLQAFFDPISGDAKDVKIILKSLNSLFIGLNEYTADVRPIHTSLFDFFLDPEQKPGTPNRYYITADQSSFTHACLRVMNEMLRFNICGLETSHLRNRDVPDFDSRVAEAIPSHLSYACCFWAYHLEYSCLNPDLLKEISDLMHDKLLYFFEVLSLLREVEHGGSGMQILKNKTKDENSELAARAAEASQFAFEFGKMMMESTPHLYLSSLPYLSNGSFVSQQFLPQYPQLLSMDFGQPISLQPEIKDSIAQRHPSARPKAVTFSPQGRQIACGFENGDLWIWDYVTGMIVSKVPGPEEKPSAVCNVVFSLDAELVYCCFEDGSILTWEAKTNKVLHESNEGLSPGECQACTISPDGRYFAFRKYGTLSFYETETRFKLFELDSEYPSGMMFSPSGSLFGFQQDEDGHIQGTRDRVVQLWDTQRQTFVPPVRLGSKDLFLEALSDNYIITKMNHFSSVFGIVAVWDIRTRAIIRRLKQDSPFPGTFTFSTNGEYLLHSEGNKRWIRKISTLTRTEEITKRFVEHLNYDEPTLTALSSDSKYIAFSTLGSRTMHVLAWDALVQEEEDLSQDIEEREVYNYILYDRTEAWLKGQHLLWKGQGSSRRCLEVYNTTRMTGLEIDFRVHFSNWSLVEVSPEDNHWSIAYVDASRADLLCLWTIDEKKEFILDRPDGGVADIFRSVGFTALSLAFSATGDRLISGCYLWIKIWDVCTRQLISTSCRETPTALTFSPMGTTFWVAIYQVPLIPLAFCGLSTIVEQECSESQNIINEIVYTIEERECSESQNTINGPFTHYYTISPSISLYSNNAYICMCAEAWRGGSHSYEILLLDHSTGAKIDCFNTHQPARFSSNQRYIAWIPEEDREKVELWDLEKNTTGDRFPFDGNIMTLGFSNDSTRIYIFGKMGKMEYHVDIWDIETKRLVRQLFFNTHQFEWTWEPTQTMALYKDSLLWVDTQETGRIWDLHVHEIMTHLYDDDMDNMLPGHLQTRRLIDDYQSHSENTEVLDYALVAWNRASFSPQTKLVDGWMLGPHDELLFWVPQKMRNGLLYPSMSFVTKPTKLNFDKFVHGTRWTECGKQL